MAAPADSGSAAAAGPQYVTLVAADKHKFVVDRRAAMVSGLIRTMLTSSEGAFTEQQSGTIELPDISSAVLERVVDYMLYKLKYNNSRVPIPEFALPPEIALEVLVAANYLDC